ncbi:hypothetical protein T472_0218180 [Youngiibacter fragilis 232.1]|uniref:Uncharacterized protein n=1 Tax=Youngiibacter fragilis 232.1 TaxID=994573 RepID=V7HZ13_9CLOT|nr:hypothetical protein T472_0218180 [Youngiibacter fragilis 232.1]
MIQAQLQQSQTIFPYIVNIIQNQTSHLKNRLLQAPTLFLLLAICSAIQISGISEGQQPHQNMAD